MDTRITFNCLCGHELSGVIKYNIKCPCKRVWYRYSYHKMRHKPFEVDHKGQRHIFFWGSTNIHFQFLSNFWVSPFEFNNITFRTVEHYYQYMKCEDETDRELILNCHTPGDAKKVGKEVKIRSEWNTIKPSIMYVGLSCKFEQNAHLKKRLLATGDSILHENSPYDMYWGFAGADMLGSLLMFVRSEIKALLREEI